MGKSIGFHVLVLFVFMTGLLPQAGHSQTVLQDDSLAQNWIFHGVGADSIDYLSQSFIADVNVITQFSVWLDVGQPNAVVTLLLCGDDGNGNADVANPLYRSIPAIPGGGWYLELGVNTNVFIGDKYWIVVEGINTFGASGYAIVGTSFEWTDTREHMYSSNDSGATWTRMTERIAVDIRGEICSTAVSISGPSDTVSMCLDDTLNIDLGAGYRDFSWSNGVTTQASAYTNADLGTISVKVVDTIGCLGSDTATLDLFPTIKPDIGFDYLDLCEGQDVILFAGLGFRSYVWNTGDSLDLIIADSSGLYIVEVTDDNQCRTKDSVQLVFHPLTFLDFPEDTAFCQGGSILLDASGPYRDWVWSNGATSSSVVANVTGEYFVIFADSFECAGKSDTLVLEVFELPDTPLVSLVGDQLATGLSNEYQWYFDGQVIPGAKSRTHTPDISGAYSVQVLDSNGCSAFSFPYELNLSNESLVVPEGFSPNEDGINDALVIDQIFFYPDAELRIFNRWGAEVIVLEGYENDWEGTNQEGKALVDGTYFYILDLKDGSSPFQGPVYIKR